jgi:hypothetical protein
MVDRGDRATEVPIRLLIDRIHDLERMILELKGDVEARQEAHRRRSRRAGWGVAAACVAIALAVGLYRKAADAPPTADPGPSWRTSPAPSR